MKERIIPMSEITVSLITNGNKVKDYVLNNPIGADSQCDLINKDNKTYLPYYTKTLVTVGHIYKDNVIDVILLNNEPVQVFVNAKDEVVTDRFIEYQNTTSLDDTFARHYTLVNL